MVHDHVFVKELSLIDFKKNQKYRTQNIVWDKRVKVKHANLEGQAQQNIYPYDDILDYIVQKTYHPLFSLFENEPNPSEIWEV